jgi:hypothetical protein
MIAFRRLLDSLSDIRLACPLEALKRVPSAQHRGLVGLPIIFTQGR